VRARASAALSKSHRKMVLRRIMGPSLETDGLLDAALSGNFRADCAAWSVMAVREKCDKRRVDARCWVEVWALISNESLDLQHSWNPTLRKVRKGWGTPCVADADNQRAGPSART
jgi:hypothetical protein